MATLLYFYADSQVRQTFDEQDEVKRQMIRRDWFKQHVEILAQALGAAVGLRKKGEIPAAVAAVEEAVRKSFGLSGQLALGLPLKDFLSLACRGEKPTAELLSASAELFREWAGLLRTEGREGEAASAFGRVDELRLLADSATPKAG